MGFIIYIISVILQIILVPLGLIVGFIVKFYDRHIGDALRDADRKFRKMAIGTDVFGNVYCEELFNATLITAAATYKFGEFGVTVSAVLGHSQAHGTLTRTGKAIAFILDSIDKDHCEKAYLDSMK